MNEPKEDLLKFLEEFDLDESLQKLTKDEVNEWIKEEWDERIKGGAKYGARKQLNQIYLMLLIIAYKEQTS